MESIWQQTASLPRFETFYGNRKTDVLIIGGGLAGLLCGCMLKQQGVESIVLEAGRICSGITKNTTAKISVQHGLIFSKLLHSFGTQTAKGYLAANIAALEQYRKLCADIPCDFQKTDSFVYSQDRSALDQELEALQKLDFPAQLQQDIPLPLECAGAVRFADQAQFHPLKFAAHIARGLEIYEHSPVRALRQFTAVTDRGRIRADKIIVATHFPFLNKHGMYFLKLYQQRSYVLALEQAQDVGGMYIGSEENSLSFRNYNDLLLLGGGGHRTGKQGGNWTQLKDFAHIHYPGARAVYRWATQDCMTLDGLPYIGQYSRFTPGLYVITGFNKWGMTNAMAGAMLLRDLVLGRENETARIFSPSRSILRPQLIVNGLESAKNLLSFSEKRCPHLGCALKWNPQERSWDCPCHGSRFTQEGKLIDNPATGDLKE